VLPYICKLGLSPSTSRRKKFSKLESKNIFALDIIKNERGKGTSSRTDKRISERQYSWVLLKNNEYKQIIPATQTNHGLVFVEYKPI
jgi:hypothetical protein